MKHIQMISKAAIVVVAALMMGAATPSARGATLIERGQSAYSIVVPDGPDEGERVGQAAKLLQSTLQEASGVTLPIVAENRLPQGARAIYLGATRAAAKSGVALQDLHGWAFVKRAVGPNLYLAGHDGASSVQNSKTEYLGTLKAVTSFLEDEVGVRYLLPGKYGTSIPRRDKIEFADTLNVSREPHMEYVTGRAPNDVVYGAANGYWGAQEVLLYGGHSHKDAVPLSKYARTHPEYFAANSRGERLVKGKPNFTQLCLSNATVKKLLVEELEKQFARGYQTVLLGQNDGQNSCKCDQCAAIHPNYTERLWIVHRKIAEIMRQKAPGKTVLLLSYGPTDNPPKTFSKFPDNTAILLTRTLQADFDPWKSYADRFDVYIYNWGNFQPTGYGPKRDPRFLDRQMDRFYDANVRGIYLCGGFENLGLEGPNYYLYGRLMQNPNVDTAQTLDEFYRAGYGRAYEPMKTFFQTLYKQMEDFSIYEPTPPTGLLRDTVFRDVDPRFRNNAADKFSDSSVFPSVAQTYRHFFPTSVVRTMQRRLDSARAQEPDAAVQARLDLVEREWTYVKDLLAVFDAHRTYRGAPSWERFDAIEATVKAREAHIVSWMGPDGRYAAPEGFPSTFGGNAKSIIEGGGFLGSLRNEPTRWDFAAIRKSGKLPPVVTTTGEKQVDALD